MKEVSSLDVVDAFLIIFSRLGFPNEIRSDRGSAFTSALTTTFLEKSGTKLVHTTVKLTAFTNFIQC